jgi:hypothetical protein
VGRLEVYEAAYKEWLPIKAQYDKAKHVKDKYTIQQLGPFIQKGFPQTLEEFEATTQVCKQYL